MRATPRTDFRRHRHLLLAVLALAHAPLLARLQRSSPTLLGDWAGTAPGATLLYTAGLCFAAFVAWLAFARFDTRAGVTLVPGRWADVGWRPIAVFVAAELAHSALVLSCGPAELRALRQTWVSTYLDGGQLLVGWLLAAKLASALAEELVYRAMLLRALEGYAADPRAALVVHAVVFELAHLYGYGLAFNGGSWFFSGLIYGYAFQTSRSVAIPTLMHVGHNLLFTLLVWTA